MLKPRPGYEIVVVETSTEGPSGGHRSPIRVLNVPDETFPEVMHVRFPTKVREAHPIGTRFRVYARLVDDRDGRSFLHTNHNWPIEVLK
jgi:hypothetical protein